MRWLDELHLEFPFAGSRMLRGLLVGEGIKIGRRRSRLGEPPCAVMAAVDHDGSCVLRRGAGGGFGEARQAGYLQYGQSEDSRQFLGSLSQTLIDRLVGWHRKVPRCGLTRTPIDQRVFPWTCRPPENALRGGFASAFACDPRRA
jgi:hypothetical protein